MEKFRRPPCQFCHAMIRPIQWWWWPKMKLLACDGVLFRLEKCFLFTWSHVIEFVRIPCACAACVSPLVADIFWMRSISYWHSIRALHNSHQFQSFDECVACITWYIYFTTFVHSANIQLNYMTLAKADVNESSSHASELNELASFKELQCDNSDQHFGEECNAIWPRIRRK